MTLTIDIASTVRSAGALVLFAAVAYLVFAGFGKLRGLFARGRFDPHDRDVLRRRFREVEEMLRQPGEMGRKMAVLEADKLLDHALKSLLMPGATLGERLKFAQYKHPALKNVWWAHRLRNQLAHEEAGRLDAAVARRAVAAFRDALERLGAL